MEKKKASAGDLERERAKRAKERFEDKTLFERGRTKVYSGEYLTAISLPTGGIATGGIQIDGKAVRRIWQIFNNFAQAFVPDSFFAVRARKGSSKPVLRALQTEPLAAFPAMKELTFSGEYPFGWYTFKDPEIPVEVSLEVFSPFIPLDERNSAIPCAVYNLTAANKGNETVEVSFLATQQNAVGCTGKREIKDRSCPDYGGNKNAIVRKDKATILHMTAEKPKDGPGFGDMALMALSDAAVATADWDDAKKLAAGLLSDGSLSGPEESGPSDAGRTLNGALSVPFNLKPGEKRTVTFVLTWYFPNATYPWGRGGGNMYTNWWPSALDIALDLKARLAGLARDTRLFHDTLYKTNLPYWLLDRMTSQLAILTTRTCFWTKEGYFGGWEGCAPEGGCCEGNCNHVWHYVQAHARLFPEIARLMREEQFGAQFPDGALPHRQIPNHGPAVDGQCGDILGAYREHLMSRDGAWLHEWWPRIKKAMEHTISNWDRDEDGVLAGAQWTTLDCNVSGSTSWLGTMYLAALAASEKMALIEGDAEAAARYAKIRKSGSAKQDKLMFNGEYYIQIPEKRLEKDFITGCGIDQVLGQWWAHQLDLGWLYPPDRIRTALKSLFKYNFKGNFRGIVQLPRKFVVDEGAGLQIVTWPKGGEPEVDHKILYASEAMTGYEYAAEAAMVQAGLTREGFAGVKAVYDRYDGRLRSGLTPGPTASWGYSGNPFGDDECGKFYARSMAIWSMLLACQGFIYDGPAGVIGFRPVWKPEDHISFFTGAEGWGLFKQNRKPGSQTDCIGLSKGRLVISRMVFEVDPGARVSGVLVKLAGKKLASTFTADGTRITISLPRAAVLNEGEEAVVEIRS